MFLILFLAFLITLFLTNIVNGWNESTIMEIIIGTKISKTNKYNENWTISCHDIYKTIGNKITIRKESAIKNMVFLVNFGFLNFLSKIDLKNKKDSAK